MGVEGFRELVYTLQFRRFYLYSCWLLVLLAVLSSPVQGMREQESEGEKKKGAIERRQEWTREVGSAESLRRAYREDMSESAVSAVSLGIGINEKDN